MELYEKSSCFHTRGFVFGRHAASGCPGPGNRHAIGVFDKDSRIYSYHDYPELVWGEPGQRICGNRIERLGVKAFPAIGAIAFYKLMHRKITRIVAPVNRKSKKQEAPTLDAQVNLDDTVTFTITPPDKPKYACYRIVMQYDIYIEEYVTYDLELTVPAPHITGEYRCYAVGYGDEGQLLSKDSNVITLSLIGKSAIHQAAPERFVEFRNCLGQLYISMMNRSNSRQQIPFS